MSKQIQMTIPFYINLIDEFRLSFTPWSYAYAVSIAKKLPTFASGGVLWPKTRSESRLARVKRSKPYVFGAWACVV